MLIRFRVKNHRSLRDEQTLSMVATEPLDDPRLLSTPAIKEKLLPVVALYGANASGKSNVLHALGFMREVVDKSFRAWEPTGPIPREPFALSNAGEEPSLYEVDFVVADVRYTYGFQLSDARVEEEWLSSWSGDHEAVWFERAGQEFDFGPGWQGETSIESRTRANSLLLSTAVQFNDERLLPLVQWLVPLWFSRGEDAAAIRTVGELLASSKKSGGPSIVPKQEVLRLLRRADVGIVNLDATDGPHGPRLILEHEGASPGREWFDLEQESHGTQRMLALAKPLLLAKQLGGVALVDEIESGLHPSAAARIVAWFQDTQEASGGQLVFTTHDATLLGREHGDRPLRRDQIWFTEKDRDGATHLYPLSDFVPIPEENLEVGYLQGRYGAVPFVSAPALVAREKKA